MTISERRPLGVRYGGRLLLIVICLLLVWWAIGFILRSSFVAVDGERYFSLFDDAMISMRYAWNLAHGAGPVWNPGEPVEGYSNPLMVAGMAIPALFLDKTAAVLAVQASGVLLLVGIGLISVAIFRDLMSRAAHPEKSLPEAFVFLAAAAYYPLAYFTLMGMETGLLSLLVTAQVYVAFRCARSGSVRLAVWVGVLAGLAYLARADSVLFSIAILVYLWVAGRSRKLGLRGAELAFWAAAILVGVVLLHRLWALSYYGSILPNTYTLKLEGVPLQVRLVDGSRFVYRYLLQVWPVALLAFAEVIFDAQREKLLMGSLVALALGYQVWVGGDPWPYWRMMASTWPMMIMLALTGLEALLRAVDQSALSVNFLRRRPLVSYRHGLSIVGCLAVGILLFSANEPFKKQIAGLEGIYTVDLNLKAVNEAVAINRVTAESASVGSIWAGAIPYYTGRYAVDFLGKSDPRIARLSPDLSGAVSWGGLSSVPGHNKYDLDYSIATLQPTYVQSLGWGRDDLSSLADSVYVEVYVRYPGRETIPLYLLRDSPNVKWSEVFIP